MIQIGGVYSTPHQQDGIFLQRHRDTNGRCIAIFFKRIVVRGQYASPESRLRGPIPVPLPLTTDDLPRAQRTKEVCPCS